MQNFTLYLTTVVLCLVVVICSQTDDKIINMTQRLRSFDRSWLKPARKPRHRTVPLYMRKLYKLQNPKTSKFSEVSCIFSQDYNSSVLTFDLSHVPNLQDASVVKLRVFKRRAKLVVVKNMYVIHLFEIHSPVKSNTSLLEKKIVCSRIVDNLRGEWLTFDVTSMIKRASSAFPSKHFLLDIESINPQLTASRPSITIGKHGHKRPMLLVFIQKDISNNKKDRPVKFDMFSERMSRFPRDISSSVSERCRRHRLYINFRDLPGSWNKRIVAPRGFSSYYCRGKCSAVMLSKEMNPSQHSFIRNLYKFITQNNDVPSACCVPTELKPTSILYFDDNQNIVLKEVPDMSVASCGCR